MKIQRLPIIICVLLSFWMNITTQAQQQEQERPIVKVIYFHPNDVTPQPDIDTKLDKMVQDVQQVFSGLMEAHGFGDKTFLFEKDIKGNAVIHTVKGKFNDTYYQKKSSSVWDEFRGRFDLSKDIYLIFLDISTGLLDGVACGYGFYSTPHKGGIVPASGECFEGTHGVDIAAHELGHSLGLAHDFRTDADANRIYLNTDDAHITTHCAAQWLDVHPAFNTGTTIRNQNTTAKMLKPKLASLPNHIHLRFEVDDPDGIHHVKLLAPKKDGDLLLRDCKTLNGTTDNTVEFVTDQLVPNTSTLTLRITDVYGNHTELPFKLSEPLPFPPPQAVTIVDPQLAAAIRKQVGTITTRTIANLTELDIQKKGIKDLTGLQHARNLRKLTLFHNNITDVTPLAKLEHLRWLELGHNPISDISPLAALTQLNGLDIGWTAASDISPLKDLKHLQFLGIHGTGISNVPPLTRFKRLKTLYLHNNTISDITSLSALTQLNVLYLSSNTISDITALAKLTQLTQLYLGNNTITDVSSLAKLTQLSILELANNRIRDVRFLSNLVNLKKLTLFGNPIENRKPLLALSQKNLKMKIFLKNHREPLSITKNNKVN